MTLRPTQHFCYECGRDIDYWQFQSYLSLCESCYGKMFPKSKPVEEDNEEDFVLGSEVAEVKKPSTFSALLETYNDKQKSLAEDDDEDFVLGSEVAITKVPEPSETTSMKFMKKGSKVLDIRQNGDVYVDGVKTDDYAVIGEAFCRWAITYFKGV